MQPGVVVDGIDDAHPAHRLAGAWVAGQRPAFHDPRPALFVGVAAVLRVGRKRDACRLHFGILLGHVERARQVQNGAAALAGHHGPCAERAAVAQAVHLVADGLVERAATDEVRVDRVRHERLVDGLERRPQSLRDHLPAVDPAPHVLRADSHIGVRAVLFEEHHLAIGRRPVAHCRHLVRVRQCLAQLNGAAGRVRTALSSRAGLATAARCGTRYSNPLRDSRQGTSRSRRGSPGRPSTRSPRMFRWISSVPPRIDIDGAVTVSM